MKSSSFNQFPVVCFSLLFLSIAKLAVYIAASNDEDLLQTFLEAKFPADYVDERGETALHCAVKVDKPACVTLLLNCDSCNPNAADGHKQTALHRAGEFGYKLCLELLVNNERVDIDAEDAWSRTALHWTVQKCAISASVCLIRAHFRGTTS